MKTTKTVITILILKFHKNQTKEVIQHAPKPKAVEHEESDHSDELAASPPLNTDRTVDLEDLEIDSTEVPEHLLSNLPEKARIAILGKLEKIDVEIAKQKKILENDVELKVELQNRLTELKNDDEEFESTSQHEIQELKDYQDAEMKKIKKERKEFEKSQKEIKSNTTKNSGGKQEIDELKAKINELRDEIKVKDKSSNAGIDKFKQELEFYTDANTKIKSQIRQIEKERINQMHSRKETVQKVEQPAATQSRPQPQPQSSIQKKTQNRVTFQNEPPSTVVAHYAQDDSVEEEEPEEQLEEVDEEDNDSEEDDYTMKYTEKYHGDYPDNTQPIEESVKNRGKIERKFKNGKRELIFSNGVRKQIFPDGYSIVFFNNKDIKQTYPDGKGVYFFSDADTTQTTFANSLKVFRFGNGQIEKHYPDDTKEICFTDGTVKCIFADGEEESVFPDGMIQRVDKHGNRTIEKPDGTIQTFHV